MLRNVLFAIFTFAINSPSFAQTDWPQFRGPGSTGVATGKPLPTSWSPSKNIAWKTDIPGRGWSSPILSKGKLFVTTVVSKAEMEAAKKGLYFGGERKTPEADQDWQVVCLDAKSGKFLWSKSVGEGKPRHSIHVKNSFASETPVTDGKLVYALFGNMGLYCLDFSGKIIWTHKLPAAKTRYGWGTASSPALHGGNIYLQQDNEDHSELIAIDCKTGKDVWRIDREEKSNWSTPFVWEHEGTTEIVTAGSGKVRSYTTSGELIWWLSGMSSITIACPYVSDGMLYVTSGYVGDKLRPVYAIKPGAKGDITPPTGETTTAFVAWSNPVIGPYNPSTLVFDGRLYVLYDRGLLSCFDSKTGKPLYQKERLENGLHFTSSPWASNGKIYCLNEDGLTWVITAGDQFKLDGTNALPEGDMFMATPVASNGSLYIRSGARIYCVREKQ